MGRWITLEGTPQRIVSLVPSQTELLFDLGQGEKVVGITRFCVHPASEVKSRTDVGGTKKVRIERVRKLNPDLVVANREENVEEEVEAISEFAPVWVSDVKDLEGAREMILALGKIVGAAHEARKMAGEIRQAFDQLPSLDSLSTLYLIWQNPFMTVGGDTFIHHVLDRCGFDNLYKNRQRYPRVGKEEIRDLAPEVILLPSEPFPFEEKHLGQMEEICPSSQIRLVDGEMFSWYGSRLLLAAPYLRDLVENFSKEDKS